MTAVDPAPEMLKFARQRLERRGSSEQRLRKRVEEIFGWWKTVAGGRKLRYIGRRKNQLGRS